MKQHGFRDIIFIGDSGPNQAGQIAVAATLNAEWAGGNTRVHAIPGYYRSDPEGDAAIMMARGIKREQIGNHADPRDTSQMMAVDPTMVRIPRSSPPMARTASRATRAVRRPRSAAPSSTRTWRAPSTSFVISSRRDELAYVYLRNRATPKGDLPAGFVWGVQAEWRRSRDVVSGLAGRPRGRRIRSTTAASSISEIKRRRPPQRGHTRTSIPNVRAISDAQHCRGHGASPAPRSGARRLRRLRCRPELSAHWSFVLARLLGGFPGAPDASIGNRSPLVRTRRY